jgi:uncharacterized lipoprotein YmbA
MKNPLPLRPAALLAGFALLLAAGCGRTPETRFYALRPLPPALDVAPPPAPAPNHERVVALAPVRLAGYLRRPQLVKRTGDYQVAYLDFDRWAGPPEEEIGEALADALAAELGAAWRVVRRAEVAESAAVPLEVEIAQMEIAPDGRSILRARWTCAGAPHEAAIAHEGPAAQAQHANLVELARRITWDVKLAK